MEKGTAKLRAAIRRRRFVAKYVGGGAGVAANGQRAVLAAGLTKNEDSAADMASRFLKQPETRADIQRALERHGATDERLLEEITKIALGDPREVQQWGEDWHKFVPSRLLSDDAARTVQGVSSETTEVMTESGVRSTTKLKLHQYDKVAALALWARIRGLVSYRFEHTGRDGGPIEHAVRFYLPVPARAREAVVIEAAALPQDGAGQNGDAPEGKAE